MAIVVMILGESGTGKSASLRNFKPEDIALVNVIGKPLPFRNRHFESLESDSYSEIISFLKKTDKKSIVIDDAQYLMANEYMRRAQEKGFDKFTEMGQNFWNLVTMCVKKLPADTIVYFLQHTERTDTGSVKAKTIGNLLDSKITLEGMFSIVLRTNVNDGEYCFRTQNNGQDTVKSPVGMFEGEEIPNDLKMVDTKIREYYELDSNTQQPEEKPEVKPKAKPKEKPKVKPQDNPKPKQPEVLDLYSPTQGIIDDDNPLMPSEPLTKFGEIKVVMDKKGITNEELRRFVAEKTHIYAYEKPISEYDPDLIDYLIANINKVYTAIVEMRNPLG